jgi:hypothetical protein
MSSPKNRRAGGKPPTASPLSNRKPIGNQAKPTTLTFVVTDSNTGAPAVGVRVSVDLGRWYSAFSKVALTYEDTDWSGKATFSIPTLPSDQANKRTKVHGQVGLWSVLYWIVRGNDYPYTYPAAKGMARVMVRDGQHVSKAIQLGKKVRTAKSKPQVASQIIPAKNLRSLLQLVVSPHKVAGPAPKGQSSPQDVERFQKMSVPELLRNLIGHVDTANKGLEGTLLAAQSVKWVQELDELQAFARQTQSLSMSVRTAKKLEEVVLLKGKTGLSRANQAVTLATAFFDVAEAFGNGDAERTLWATTNAAVQVGMTATPITAGINLVLSFVIGPDWPSKVLGLGKGKKRPVQSWTSHKDFIVDHQIRSSPSKFRIRGGTSCTVSGTLDGQCRIHYLGYDHSTGYYQWAAVRYKKKSQLVPGLTFANDEKGLVVILGGGEIVPITKEVMEELNKNEDNWVGLYNAIYGTYYGR